MARQRKDERNKKLIKLRKQNPGKWSFTALAKEFNIKKQTAHEIYQKYGTTA